jgi:hypothetical protein
MRFFTESRNMDEALLGYYIAIYAVTMSYLIVPFGTFFSTEPDEDIEEYAAIYIERLLEKKMSKKDLDIFYEFIDQYQEKIAKRISKDDWHQAHEWEGLIDGDPDRLYVLNKMIIPSLEATDLALITQYHNYFLFDKFLKDHMRDALYECFPDKDLISTKEDQDELVEIFFNNFVYPYTPPHASLETGFAMESTERSGWTYDKKDTFITDYLDRDFFAWELYNKGINPNRIETWDEALESPPGVYRLRRATTIFGGKKRALADPVSFYSWYNRRADWSSALENSYVPGKFGTEEHLFFGNKLSEKVYLCDYWWNYFYGKYDFINKFQTTSIGSGYLFNGRIHRAKKKKKELRALRKDIIQQIIIKKRAGESTDTLTVKAVPIENSFAHWLTPYRRALRDFDVIYFKDYRIPGRINTIAKRATIPQWVEKRAAFNTRHLFHFHNLLYRKTWEYSRPWRPTWRYFYLYDRRRSPTWWNKWMLYWFNNENIIRKYLNPMWRSRMFHGLAYINLGYTSHYLIPYRMGLTDFDSPLFIPNALQHAEFWIRGLDPNFGKKKGEKKEPEVEEMNYIVGEWADNFQPVYKETKFNSDTPFSDVSVSFSPHKPFDTYFFDTDVLDIMLNLYYYDPTMLLIDYTFIVIILGIYFMWNYMIRLLIIKFIKKEPLNKYNIFPILQTFTSFRETIKLIRRLFLYAIGAVILMGGVMILGWHHQGAGPLDILLNDEAPRKIPPRKYGPPIVLPRELGQKNFYEGPGDPNRREPTWPTTLQSFYDKYSFIFYGFIAATFVFLFGFFAASVVETMQEMSELDKCLAYENLNRKVKGEMAVRDVRKNLVKYQYLTPAEQLRVVANTIDSPVYAHNMLLDLVQTYADMGDRLLDEFNVFVEMKQETCRVVGQHIYDPVQHPRYTNVFRQYLVQLNKALLTRLKKVEYHMTRLEGRHTHNTVILRKRQHEEFTDYDFQFMRIERRVIERHLDDMDALRALYIAEHKLIMRALSHPTMGTTNRRG